MTIEALNNLPETPEKMSQPQPQSLQDDLDSIQLFLAPENTLFNFIWLTNNDNHQILELLTAADPNHRPLHKIPLKTRVTREIIHVIEQNTNFRPDNQLLIRAAWGNFRKITTNVYLLVEIYKKNGLNPHQFILMKPKKK